MKTIAILSSDAVPLPLKENYPEVIKEGNKEFKTKDKCLRTTCTGKRSWRFAEHLSKHKDFDVTVFIPDLNMPGKEYIDHTKLNFGIQSYHYKSANWNWSEELDDKLKKFNFVILQSTTGTGFRNCAVLPRSVNVILDGWIPYLAELPCTLLNYRRAYRKINWSKTFLVQYQDLLRRANCVLYASDRQHYHYEGQFFMIQKLDWHAFRFSPLLRVPYGIDNIPKIERKVDPPLDKLSLLWYGPIYPWYYPELLIDQLKNIDNVQLDFVGVVHPRYQKIYYKYYKKFFDEIDNIKNMNVIEDYCDNSLELFSKYDAGIVIAQDWLEEKYSFRTRILEMVSSGLPVVLNQGNTLYDELDFLRDVLFPVDLKNIKNDIINIASDKSKLNVTTENIEEMRKRLSWENVLSPLIDYIERF